MTGLATTALALLAIPALTGLRSETINFDKFQQGMLPPYWTAAATGGGTQARWEIRRDSHAPTGHNVLAQTSSPDEDRLPLLIYDRTLCKDSELSVKFKITGGRRHKAAGIVFRYQDTNNYYLLQVTADPGRIELLRVKDGKAIPLPLAGAGGGPAGVHHEIKVNEWYVAKIASQGDHFRVSFGNRRLFEAVDSGIREPGKAGLLTRGGTSAEFDDFRISPRS